MVENKYYKIQTITLLMERLSIHRRARRGIAKEEKRRRGLNSCLLGQLVSIELTVTEGIVTNEYYKLQTMSWHYSSRFSLYPTP